VARKNVKETTMEARFNYFASPLALKFTDMHTKDALHAGKSQGSTTRASKHRNTDITQTPAIATVMPR
jgi:hypothetical protein